MNIKKSKNQLVMGIREINMANWLVSGNSRNNFLLIDQKTLLYLTPGLPKPPLLDDVDYGETVYTHRSVRFSSYDYRSTQGRTIYYLILNSSSLSASTLVVSTIGSHHTAEK